MHDPRPVDSFYFVPILVRDLCYVVLLASFGVYLATRPGQSPARRWLAAFCLLLVVEILVWDLPTVTPLTRTGERDLFWSYALGAAGIIPTMGSLLLFAYAFHGDLYPRESGVARALVGAAAGAVLVVFFVGGPGFLFSPGFGVVFIVTSLMCVALVVWAVFVFARKTVRFSREAGGAERSVWEHLARPSGRRARATRAFLLWMLSLVALNVASLLAYGLRVAAFETAFTVVLFLVLYGLVVTYATHAPEPTTVQVKLVGAVLATVMLFLALVVEGMFNERVLLGGDARTPEPHTLRFEPAADGGYTVEQRPLNFVAGPAELLDIPEYGTAAVEAHFPVAFYGTRAGRVFVSREGTVAVGQTVRPAGVVDLYGPAPKVAAFLGLFRTEVGQVAVRRDSARLVLTWADLVLSRGDPADRYTFQVVFHRDGALDLTAATPAGQPLASDLPRLGGRGVHPGGDAEVRPLSLPASGPLRVGPGEAVLEEFGLRAYPEAGRIGRRLLLFFLAATALCLFVLPLVFRASVLTPLGRLLDGVVRVERGDLDTEVEVQSRDEVGRLVEHFNAMTASVREAEAQLQAHAAELEDRVRERTAELAASLDELKAAQAQLVQAEKMASLGQLTAGIAHEIKNPLNFVNNFAGLSRELLDELAEEGDPDERAALLADLRMNAAKIEEHGRRADAIVRSMMEHARGGSGERQRVDLNALVRESAEHAVHAKAVRHPDTAVDVSYTLADGLGAVEASPQEIGRVVVNLVDNALDAVRQRAASGEGGYAPAVSVETRRGEGWAEVWVRDNGPGLEPEAAAKVFEPFYTTKPTGEGTGLGLSMSYDIVTQGYGGSLAVESGPDGGTSFVVRLPVSE